MSSRRHFLGLWGVSKSELLALIERSAVFATQLEPVKPLDGRVVANLFFESSTRTRSSFEVSAAALGAHVLNWTASGSSVAKGETLVDTARTIAALGAHVIVLRHPHSGSAQLLSEHVDCAIVNAGDGQHEHPSQGLLDAFTLWQRWRGFEGRRVIIVGDVLHSRVARSNIFALTTLGAQVTVCGPKTLIPPHLQQFGVKVSHTLDACLAESDAVMVLRLQKERQAQGLFPSEREYRQRYGLTVSRAALLKSDALVLHPGPMNRDVEIDAAVADGPFSLILEQVRNGVAVRKAILESMT
jgi:aspartate carbamoyltransferase catalytic subunit